MPECCFCPSTEKLTGEHVWSDWMNGLFPEGRVTFQQLGADGSKIRDWPAQKLNHTTNVVCEKCNNGWMSRMENEYAKPAMADLILGKRVGAISQRRARGLSLFAFKTALIADCSLPEKDYFFAKSERYAFRESLTIPPDVRMWLLGMEPRLGGAIRNHSVHYRPNYSLNICSFWVGQLGFQVVSAKSARAYNLESLPTPPGLTFLFYPTLEPGISWPRKKVLGVDAFNDFSSRWNKVREN